MPLQAKAGFSGLVTTTAETTGAPTGLRIADNVVLRKEGALMPRPTFASTALARAYAAAFPYKGQQWFANILGGTNLTYYGPNEIAIGVSGVTLLPVRQDVFSMREARGNLYVTSLQGVYKVAGTGPWGLYASGLSPITSTFRTATLAAATSDDLLTTGQQVAYRLVTVWTDLNGVIVRSRPTGAIIVSASATGSPSLTIDYSVTPFYVTQHTVELYRSRVFPTTAQIDEELQLVYTFTPPSTSSGSFTYVDKVPDIRRGVTLYTSPSRGGIENANDRAPGCACLERFRSSLFFGNTVSPQRVVLSYKVSTANLAGVATGIGTRGTTGTIAAGSNQITAVGSTVGVQIGQVVASQANGRQTPPQTVTAIAGATVTVSTPFTLAQAAQPVSFYDAITIDGYPVILGGGGVHGVALTTMPTTSTWMGIYGTNGGTLTAYEITPPTPGYDQTVVIERVQRGGAAFQVRASHGDEMSPAVPLGGAATGLLSKNDVLTHGLAWSEPDEPEHVPPKNFARVGDAGKAILALAATKDRMLIFKEDGLYMLTGTTARDFGIYPLDTTCLCILPGSVRRLKNTVYLLSNLGIVAVDDSGSVSVVSRPIQLEVATIVNAIRAAHKATGLYNMPGLSGVTGAGDDAQGEYHLALGSSTPSFGGQVLVYSIPRDGYTTFSFGTPAPVALSTDGEGQPLVLTASSLLTPSTTLGTVAARVSPRGFSDPAMLGKFWSHVAAAFSQLTGTTNVQARFTSSESQVTTNVTETLEAPLLGGLVEHPLGTLMRHPVPRAVQRAYLLFVELLINVSTGTFTLEAIAAESRENAPNKRPTHGSGAT